MYRMNHIKKIHSSIHDYEILFESDFSFLNQLLQTEDAVFIIDKNVFELYSSQFIALEKFENVIILSALEENKTLKAVEAIYDKVISFQPTKKTKIISIGGGIIQDVSGFVASTFYRGLSWIYVPTTLLAQADSCMGSKTSLNYKSFKNILGTFYPPHQIYICSEFTSTLSIEDFYSGMGEVVKLHIMGGANMLEKLLKQLPAIHDRNLGEILNATQSSLDIKWTYMDGDEFDQGKRNLLNYGHEFGHAIETATHYKISHGQAIIIGMIMANHISYTRRSITKQVLDQVEKVLIELLKTEFTYLKNIQSNQIILAMKQDKKRIGNKLPLIMMDGEFLFFKILDLNESEAEAAISNFITRYCS